MLIDVLNFLWCCQYIFITKLNLKTYVFLMTFIYQKRKFLENKNKKLGLQHCTWTNQPKLNLFNVDTHSKSFCGGNIQY